MQHRIFKGFSAIAASVALAACGGGSGTGEGSLSLSLTDAPVDSLQSVVITFTGVSIKPADGEAIYYGFDGEEKVLDLLDYQNGNVASLLDSKTVGAGKYNWIRLHLSEDNGDLYVIDDNNGQHTLYVPSGAQTGLKLVSGFTVPAGGSADFTIDFDVRKSITYPDGQNQYFLKPALRLIDNVQAGSIAGTVDSSTTLQTECENPQDFAGVVYVFEGADSTPIEFDSTDGTEEEALVAVPVADEDENGVKDGVYIYKAAFLPEGDYTVTYSCDIDEMDSNDSVSFTGTTTPVSVEAQKETTVNF